LTRRARPASDYICCFNLCRSCDGPQRDMAMHDPIELRTSTNAWKQRFNTIMYVGP
ncbi:hypothetical protein ACLOJK_014283, partial [Asimina triloba]